MNRKGIQVGRYSPSIFLVGFMACGKTTVGPILAERLDRPFIDLDRLIEARSGATIAEIIRDRGEEYFRRLETEMLQGSLEDRPVVVAPGGGAILRAENRELMGRHGLTVWLDAPFELCWQRITEDSAVRPLAPDESTARARFEQRVPLYRQADRRISIEHSMPPEEIAEKIVEALSAE